MNLEETPVQRATRWGAYFAATWQTDTPVRIHAAKLAPDGTHEWDADFARWMSREEGRASERKPEEQLRTQKVMRRLRRAAVREYEVLYRMLVHRESLEQTTRWLNQRAAANGIPLPPGRSVHYRPKDTLALYVCGIEYALAHW